MIKEVHNDNGYRVDVVLSKKEVEDRVAKNKMSPVKTLCELIYGNEKPFSKPFFLNGGAKKFARKRKTK